MQSIGDQLWGEIASAARTFCRAKYDGAVRGKSREKHICFDGMNSFSELKKKTENEQLDGVSAKCRWAGAQEAREPSSVKSASQIEGVRPRRMDPRTEHPCQLFGHIFGRSSPLWQPGRFF